MDEQSWLNCQDPAAMLEWLHGSGKPSDRKLRLFAVACCRRVWHLLPDEASRKAVEVAERQGEGLAINQELRAACDAAALARAAFAGATGSEWGTAEYAADAAASLAAGNSEVTSAYAADAAAYATEEQTGEQWHVKEAEQCSLLRDLFGNPFRPVALEPAWLTPQVVALARRAYEERKLPEGTLDLALLAALADALEDAGCTDPDVLRHCRWEEGHVRGCWVVDLLLQKG